MHSAQVHMLVSVCVHFERERERERDLRAVANIREGNEILYRVEIYKASSEFNGFPWILVTPHYQNRTL